MNEVILLCHLIEEVYLLVVAKIDLAQLSDCLRLLFVLVVVALFDSLEPRFKDFLLVRSALDVGPLLPEFGVHSVRQLLAE